jgi:hypothetical protein
MMAAVIAGAALPREYLAGFYLEAGKKEETRLVEKKNNKMIIYFIA